MQHAVWTCIINTIYLATTLKNMKGESEFSLRVKHTTGMLLSEENARSRI